MSEVANIYLEKLIQDLLHEQNCVIVPKFGGFVAQYKSASLETSRKVILPPSKELSFNAQLKRNDGLLAQAVCECTGLNYDEALKSIEHRVDYWSEKLEETNFLELDKIGSFVKNSEGNLVFEQFNEANYRANSFGLGVVNAQPIEREGIVRRIEKEIKAKPKSISNLKQGLMKAAAVALIFGVCGALAAKFGGDKLEANFANINLFDALKSSSNKEVVESNNVVDGVAGRTSSEIVEFKEFFDPGEQKLFKSYGHVGDENLAEIVKIQEQKGIDPTELNAVVNPTVENKKAASINKAATIEEEIPSIEKSVGVSTSSKSHLVIAGCFRKGSNARKMVKSLKKEGFPAVIAGTTPKGLTRVCYGAFDNKVDAMKLLAKAKLNHNKNAWLTSH